MTIVSGDEHALDRISPSAAAATTENGCLRGIEDFDREQNAIRYSLEKICL